MNNCRKKHTSAKGKNHMSRTLKIVRSVLMPDKERKSLKKMCGQKMKKI